MNTRKPTGRAWGASIAIGVVGLLATAAATWFLAQRIEDETQEAFDRVVQQVVREVPRRFARPVFGLRGLAGTYAASAAVTAPEFAAYVGARNLDIEFPGVRGFGFIERVAAGEVDTWLAAAQADHAPSLAIRALTASPPSPRYLIRYIEPAERNIGARGLDVGSEANRRAALERAIDSGEVALTDPIVLVQDDRQTPGFLICLPLYLKGHTPATPAARREALRGVLYAPVVASELLADVNRTTAAGMAEFVLSANAPIFDSGVSANGPRVGHRRDLTVQLLDRQFQLSVRSTRAFEATVDRSPVWMATTSGLVITLLLVGLSRVSDTARWRAERRVAEMTAELQQLAAVARATGDGVLLLDVGQRIVWVNEAFTRTTGYTLEEARGRQPGSLLASDSADPQGLQHLNEALGAGHAFQGELCNRRKNGSHYWIDVEIQPQRDASGALTGWIAVESDITVRRDTEAALAAALRDNHALLDTIRQHAIVSIADRHGRIVEVNDAFCRISGYTQDELLGQDHRVVNSGHHTKEFWRAMWRNLAAGQSWRGEVCNRTSDGQLYWVDSIVAPFMDADGRIEKYVSVRFDITAAKASALELARERERLATILAGTGAGTWEHDYGTGEDVVNERYALMLGETPQSFAQAEGGFLARVHPDDQALVMQANAAHAEGRADDYQCEFRMRHRDGSWVWVQSRGRIAERDADGRPVRMAGIHLDVSERHAQHAALQRAHETMQTIFENLPSAVSVFGPDLRLKACNSQYRSLLGFPDELFDEPEPAYERFIRINAERGEYGRGDPDEIVRMAVARASGTVVRHQFERTRPDGTIIEVRGAPMPGGGFVSTYTDVTRERAALVDAERSRNLLLGAIETIAEPFAIYDPDDRLVLCNERYRQVYADVADLIEPGVQFETLIRAGAQRGGYVEAQGRVEEWVRDRLAQHLRADTDHLQPLADGRTLRILERRLPDGHIVGFRIDVTELVRARQNAEAASQAKSQFLANMSHEIRTPMNAILGLLTLLRRTALDAQQADYATKTEGAARSLLALLNDILDFSKVEAGKMELDPQPFRIGSLLRDLQVLLEAARGGKGVALTLAVDASLPPALVGDALRLQQVLLNLGSNALKFTERGEVVLAVRVLDGDRRKVRLRFSVRDTGIGIAPEHQARIFSGFTQAEASTTRRFGGTGLGVAISQRLVGLMGGELKLQSQPGLGSRFWFDIDLPLVEDGAAASDGGVADGAGGQARLAGLQLLVAEDNPNNQQVARELLEGEGAVVTLADNGRLALQALAESRFDAVLMDLQMPVLDGLDATRELRAAGHRLPVIGLTANAMAQDRQACLDAGMDAHVGKPFDLRQLVALIRRLTGPAAAPGSGGASAQAATADVSSRTAWSADPADMSQEDEVQRWAEEAGVKLHAALNRFGGRRDIYLRAYLEFVSRGLDEVHAGLVDPAEARRAVHGLKGLAATLGMDALSAQAAEVEDRIATVVEARTANLPDDALPALLMAIETVRAPLQVLGERLARAWSEPAAPSQAAGTSAPSGAPLAVTLAGLRSRLQAADMDALDWADRLLTLHGRELGQAGQRLHQAVHGLDFDAALALIPQLDRAPA